MTPGDVVLISLPQFGGGGLKLRPALLLADLPGPYQNLLLYGVSTQLQQLQANWDELIQGGDADFSSSGLHRASAIRLGYLYAADSGEIAGVIGSIDRAAPALASASSGSSSEGAMKVIYDKETDTLSIILRSGKVAESDETRPGLILDCGKSGELLSLELLDASEQVTAPQSVEFALGRRMN